MSEFESIREFCPWKQTFRFGVLKCQSTNKVCDKSSCAPYHFAKALTIDIQSNEIHGVKRMCD